MLDDGACFEGFACGAGREAEGEVVFTTGMTGYQETLSDPSFYGQIVAFTSAHTGNYGATPLDDEGPGPHMPGSRVPGPRASGAVFHDLFTEPAGEAGSGFFPHWRATESLDRRLAREGVTGITGVDTRALTLHLREHGARGGVISALDLDRPSLLRRARALPPMRGRDLARLAGCDRAYAYDAGDAVRASAPPSVGGREFTVAVMDFGCKRSILTHLCRSGMKVTVWPAATSAEDILGFHPDGVLLSNGPGDPEPCGYAVKAIRKLLGKVPIFGICLGHQLLGLALGAKTYKLPFGHHGMNHPVIDLVTHRVCVTSQNHGFCVDPHTLPVACEATHWNLNDNTLEGLAVKDAPAFSVQFHPEAAPGPADAANLFGRFRDLMAESC